jgi:hypothetical protein
MGELPAALLDEAIETLERLGCQFGFCDGPTLEPVDMKTCYACEMLAKLRAYRAGQAATPDGPRTWALPDDREKAKAAIHRPLHDLNVRIVALKAGDCHCNLIAEVVLDALTDATPAADGQDGDGRDG